MDNNFTAHKVTLPLKLEKRLCSAPRSREQMHYQLSGFWKAANEIPGATNSALFQTSHLTSFLDNPFSYLDVYFVDPAKASHPISLIWSTRILSETMTMAFVVHTRNHFPTWWTFPSEVHSLFVDVNVVRLSTEIASYHVLHFLSVLQPSPVSRDYCLFLVSSFLVLVPLW